MSSLRSDASRSLGLCLVLAAAGGLLGCGLAAFTLGYDLAERRVTGSPLGGVLPLELSIPLSIDLAAETAARDTGPAQHVRLVAMSLTVTSGAEPTGDADDLSFVDGIDVYVESAREGSSLPRVRVAHLDPAPDGQRTLSLDCEDVDLVQYLREGARMTASARGTVPPDDVTYAGHLEFAVEVL